MRIEQVNAKAFGPFKSLTVQFAPGFTLVHGPNESGKSTLHAATYAAVCGRKRGRGAGNLAEREFRRKHQPWDGQAWAVGSEIALADGRRIALNHDLLGRVDCTAVDAALGRDVSGEIMHGGAPDGAKFLGLNRESFAAVAVVNQAQLLAILDSAGGLQGELQRAAASAAGERPAAGAISGIEAFHKENVGSPAAKTKPLRRSQAAEDDARKALKEAQEQHAEYLRLLAEAQNAAVAFEAASRAAQEAKAALDRARELASGAKELARLRIDLQRANSDAADARARYDEAKVDAEEARRLHDRFGGVEPVGLGEGEHLAQQVGSAVGRWQHAPQIPVLTGPTAAELQAQIDALPQHPEGDLEVHPQVGAAAESLTTARRSAERRTAAPAPDPLSAVESAAQRVGASRLRELAHDLAAAPDLDGARTAADEAAADLTRARDARDDADAARSERHTDWQHADAALLAADQAVSDARLHAAAPTSNLNMPLLVAGAAIALGGAALIGFQAMLGGALLVVGAAIAVLALRGSKSAQADPPTGPVADAVQAHAQARTQAHLAKAELDDAEQALQRTETTFTGADLRATHAASALRRAEQTWERLTGDCAAAGLPREADELRRMATLIETWQRQHDDHQRYLQGAVEDRQDIERAERLLDEALTGRGAPAEGALEERLVQYRQACRARAEQARKANQRQALLVNLQQRRANEANAVQSMQARTEAFEALVAAAVAIGAIQSVGEALEADADRLTAALQQWMQLREADLDRAQQDQRDWSALQRLLHGGTVDDLMGALQEKLADVDRLSEAETQAQGAVRDCEHEVASLAATIGLDPAEVCAQKGVQVASEHAVDAAAEHKRCDDEADKLRLEASDARTRAKVMAKGLVPVADAETDLAAAVAELQRVQRLDQTLSRTLGFLRDAQERVHRDIAPKLAESIERRLATVTSGRYTRVRINPENLQVQVAPPAGDFVEADRLSFGTTEQIYLLVRIALAEMLGNGTEPCPLLLDDVTVHADGVRTPAILQTLLTLSEERQIILFSQEDDVRRWADATLTDAARHKVIGLGAVPAGS